LQRAVTGSITAADISVMGKKHYGYLGIQTDDKEQIKIKVTAFTVYDTLDVGARVVIELESVGDAKLLNAKTITLAK
jgi:hypothetical protein